MFEVKNLNVNFGQQVILHDINLKIEKKNSVIGLFGPNGAGKTTLINVLAGAINQYTGELINVDKNNLSYLPDKPFLYKFMKLKEIIEYYKAAFKDFDFVKAERLLKDLGLQLEQKIAQCSKGMEEQIHMILSICRNVDLYIFDEPLAAVDPLTRDAIMNMIQLERKRESVVLISTHLISDVEDLFDSVIMIKKGEILLYEDVECLTSKYQGNLETIFKEKLK